MAQLALESIEKLERVLVGAIPNFFSLPWPPGVPAGTYTFAVLTTPAMAFAHGAIDITAFTEAGLEASP